MKKLLLTGVMALTFSSSVLMAQESKTDKIFRTFRFGLFLGPSFNSLKPTAASSDNYIITKGKGNVGFSFGITADYNANERYTLYTGAGIDWRGGSIEAAHDSTQLLLPNYLKDAAVKYKKMQYLAVPIGLKMKAIEFDKYKIFAQTGFDFGILLSQKGDYTLRLANDSIVSKSNEKLGGVAKVVPVNIGWCIGAGVEYSFNEKNSFFATILYRNGFVDATAPQTNDKGWRYADGNIRSNSLLIRVGYFF